MTRRRRSIAGRDQHVSAFSATLMRLCDATGAHGAALVDAEGETVDYAGHVEPFDIKVAAAEASILLALLRDSRVPAWTQTDAVLVRARRKSFFFRTLSDGYALVMQLPGYAFAVSPRAVGEAIVELCQEAGFDPPRALQKESDRWHRVDVRCDGANRRRPVAIWLEGGWVALEVIGRWAGQRGAGEIGYRTRLSTGAEVNLMREPFGRWYTDTALSK